VSTVPDLMARLKNYWLDIVLTGLIKKKLIIVDLKTLTNGHFWRHDIQHIDIQHNDLQRNVLIYDTQH
jgi:hypothetical protein